MQKILKWFAPILMIGVAVFIVLFLISINSINIVDNTKPLTYVSNVSPKKLDDFWLNKFSKTEKLNYFYPVSEVYVKVDLDENIEPKKTYKLSASLLDPYQLFCLKEELKQHKLRYYLKRDKSGVELLIFSKDIKKLNSLVKILKNYQISAIVKPYKKEI